MAQSELQTIKEELLAKLASKEEVAEVKKDVSGLKGEVTELKEVVVSLEHRTEQNSNTISKLINKLLEMDEKMVTKEEHQATYNTIIEKLDKLIGKFDEQRIEMTAQDAKSYRLENYIKEESQRNDLQDKMLQRHDSRIKKLESVTN